MLQVKLETKVLGERLKQLQAVVDNDATISAYTHVLLTAAGGVATLRAYSPTIGMFEAKVKAEHNESGALLLPTKKLVEISGYLLSETVTLTDGKTEDDGSSNVIVRCGNYKSDLRARPSTEFKDTLERPTAPLVTLGLPGLKELLERVKIAVPDSNGKHTSSVGLLDFKEGELAAVGTDGWKLALAILPGTFRTPDGKVPPALSVPKAAFNLISQLSGGTVTISDTETAFFFQTDTEILATLKVQGTFPPYQRVIPTAKPVTVFTVTKDVFEYALGRALPVSEEESQNLVFNIPAQAGESRPTPLIIRAKSDKVGMTNDTVDAEASGAPQEFTLRGDYLKEFVERAGDKVQGEILAPNAIMTFLSGPNYRFYIMPIVG